MYKHHPRVRSPPFNQPLLHLSPRSLTRAMCLRTSNDENLTCRVTRHEEAIFAIPRQARRAETAVGTTAHIPVLHDIDGGGGAG